MNSIWTSIILSLLTGVISSTLVVLYFEIRQSKKYALTRAHILDRFSRELFHILTVVRVACDLKLEDTSFENKLKVVGDLERILGRNNPSVLMDRILNLSPEQHRNVLNQLIQINGSLSVLFTHSIGHKTVEDNISASIAEVQEWIDSVLHYYTTFPEIIDKNIDQAIYVVWMTGVSNLVENTFSILKNVLKKQNIPDEVLRWGKGY